MIQILVILALCWGGMDGYRFLQDELPNGDRVPHPCKANFMWEGVGHKNVEGGGDRNPFGKDFAKNGKVSVWFCVFSPYLWCLLIDNGITKIMEVIVGIQKNARKEW